MALGTSRTLLVVRRYGLLVVSSSVAGLLLHFGMVGIEALMIGEPVLLAFQSRFWRSAFSFPFLPILLMEVGLTALTLVLWSRLRRTLHEAHDLDLQRERHETRLRTLQRAMALMAHHLAEQNNQILQHIAMRREKGQQPSPAIETASRRVAEILLTLSEVSFVTPGRTEGDGVDLIEELERRLQERDAARESPGAYTRSALPLRESGPAPSRDRSLGSAS
ncbi:MAG: hypothetical protein AB7I25_02840 [Vicinamibacterales bacterium]